MSIDLFIWLLKESKKTYFSKCQTFLKCAFAFTVIACCKEENTESTKVFQYEVLLLLDFCFNHWLSVTSWENKISLTCIFYQNRLSQNSMNDFVSSFWTCRWNILTVDHVFGELPDRLSRLKIILSLLWTPRRLCPEWFHLSSPCKLNDMESGWSPFKTATMQAAASLCGQRVVWVCHGGGQRPKGGADWRQRPSKPGWLGLSREGPAGQKGCRWSSCRKETREAWSKRSQRWQVMASGKWHTSECI